MGYEIALEKAWREIEKISASQEHRVPLLADVYSVNVDNRKIVSNPSDKSAEPNVSKESNISIESNAPIEESLAILILHYLIGMLKNGYKLSGDWISFREVEGGKVFFPAYRDLTIKPLIECFTEDQEGLVESLLERFKGRMVRTTRSGDISMELLTFPDIYIRVLIWSGEESIPPDATILFDRSLTGVYSTEDIAVFLKIMVAKIIEAV